MKPFYKKSVSVDQLQHYLTSQVTFIPELYDHFLDCLEDMERKELVSLVPITIFQLYHRRFNKSIAQRRKAAS